MKKSAFTTIISFSMTILLLFSVVSFGVSAMHENASDPIIFERLSYNKTIHLDDGGKIYVYEINGVKTECPVPPKNFHPLNATDEQLSTYGFPPRPSKVNKEEYNEWVALVSSYKRMTEPLLEIANRPITSSANLGEKEQQPRVTTGYSSNWSGYYSKLGSSSTSFYAQTQVDYTQPTISGTYGTTSRNVVSYWTGIGGAEGVNSALVQAGTSTTGSSDHWAWYEYLNTTHMNPAVRITSLTISAGDNIHVYVSYQKANKKFNYYIANNSTGQSASSVLTFSTNEYFDGSSVEWIAEKPSWYLPNFTSVKLKNCKAMLNTSTGWESLSSLVGVKKVILTDTGTSTGTLICKPGSISSNHTFNCVWKAYC